MTRKKGTPPEEIEETAKRIRKYPEHRRSARNNKAWLDFLNNIGVNPDILESEKGRAFWGKVRKEIKRAEVIPESRLKKAGLTPEYSRVKRGAGGRFASIGKLTDIVIYRGAGGRFASAKNI